MNKYTLIKWNGFIWYNVESSKPKSEIVSAIFNEGVYITQVFKNKLLKLSLSKNGKLISDNFNEEFLRKLINRTSKLNVVDSYPDLIFTFLFIIRYFQEDTQNPDYFQTIEYHILKPSNPRIPDEE